MTFEVHQGGAADAVEAAAWVVRLSASEPNVIEFEAFEAWLAGSPARALAYDEAVAVWARIPVESQADAVAPVKRRASRANRWANAGWGAGLAAAAAAAVVVVLMGPLSSGRSYVTTVGERRDVALADGSRVMLNANTRITVKLSQGRRDVALARGEAAFDVAKDIARPFLIHISERSVRVVGTEFDVKTQGDALVVAVRRGVVEVRARDGASPVRLVKGDELSFAENTATPQVRRVDPDAAFAWRADKLVYRDATMGQVVDGLNQRFGAPTISVDDRAARLPFSGVLVLDTRDQVVRRLTMAEPLSARTTASGIVLSMDQKQPR